MSIVGRPVSADAIPDGERHAEKALPADAPVAVAAVHPDFVARAHVAGMPLQLPPTREQLFAELNRLDEPLTAGHDFERTITLLVELDLMRDRPRLTHEVATLAQQIGGDSLRLLGGQTSHLV